MTIPAAYLLAVASDQSGATPRIVTETQAWPIISADHMRVHLGHGFQVAGTVSNLASAGVAYFLVSPTATLHWRFYRIFADGAPVEIEFYENATVSANGSALPAYNRNRNSAITSATSIYSGPTVTGAGTKLFTSRVVGSGVGANATGEVEGIEVEWILNPAYKYLLKITNNSGGNVNLVYQFFWYEDQSA